MLPCTNSLRVRRVDSYNAGRYRPSLPCTLAEVNHAAPPSSLRFGDRYGHSRIHLDSGPGSPLPALRPLSSRLEHLFLRLAPQLFVDDLSHVADTLRLDSPALRVGGPDRGILVPHHNV